MKDTTIPFISHFPLRHRGTEPFSVPLCLCGKILKTLLSKCNPNKQLTTWAVIFILTISATIPSSIQAENLLLYSRDKDLYRIILDPKHRTTLSSEVSTTIKTIHKEMGEPFVKGDILIELDEAVFHSRYLKAASELERAETDFNAKQELFKANSASLLDLKAAEAALTSAKADLTIAEKQLASCTIKAPYNGKVVELSFETHELVQPGDELIELVNDTILIAKFLVPSLALEKLSIGKQIGIYIHETDSTENATIAHISSVIDPASSTVKVDAEINNTDSRLRSGMIGWTRLHPPESEDADPNSTRD